MPDDFVVNVRQITQYPQLRFIGNYDYMLVQQGGYGGPFACVTQDGLLAQVFQRVNVGILPAPDNVGIASSYLITPQGQRQGFNWYVDTDGVQRFLQGGPAGAWTFAQGTWQWSITLPGEKDDVINSPDWNTVLTINPQGDFSAGQILLSRDPTTPLEAATKEYVDNVQTQLTSEINALENSVVLSWNGRIGDVNLTLADVTALGNFAFLASPQFTGSPSVNGDPIATNSYVQTIATQYAALAVANMLATQPLVYSWNGQSGNVVLQLSDITGVGGAQSDSPAFTGLPTAPTPALNDSSNEIATTAFVQNNVSSINNALLAQIENVQIQLWDCTTTAIGNLQSDFCEYLSVFAQLTSPNFSGMPTGPTPEVGSNDDKLATTAFVQQAIEQITHVGGGHEVGERRHFAHTASIPAGAWMTVHPLTSIHINEVGTSTFGEGQIIVSDGEAYPTSLLGTDLIQVGGEQAAVVGVLSWNHRHGEVHLTTQDIVDAGGAPIHSPHFTGQPEVETPPPGSHSHEIPDTIWVNQLVQDRFDRVVDSWNGRRGEVRLRWEDLEHVGAAPIESPHFRGIVRVSNPPQGDRSDRPATTCWVDGLVSDLGKYLRSRTVFSFNQRRGNVTLRESDVSALGVAFLHSPFFSGEPRAPTPPPQDNSPRLATTRYVDGAISSNRGPPGPPGLNGAPGEQGPPGRGLRVVGHVQHQHELPEHGNQEGDIYLVGNADGFWWDGCTWLPMGHIAGAPGPVGPQGPMGEGIHIKGTVPNASMLPPGQHHEVGDIYLTENDGHGHVWNGHYWFDFGYVRGPQGIPGPAGAPGPVGPPGPPGSNVASGPDAPANPQVGDMWFNTTNDTVYVWNGTDWIPTGVADLCLKNAGGQERWCSVLDGTPESGSPVNSGSNMVINRYADTGTLLGPVVTFDRRLGFAKFARWIDVTGYIYLRKDSPGASASIIGYNADGAARWTLEMANQDAEAAGSVGSNFELKRWLDSGPPPVSVLKADRETGRVSLAGELDIQGKVGGPNYLWKIEPGGAATFEDITSNGGIGSTNYQIQASGAMWLAQNIETGDGHFTGTVVVGRDPNVAMEVATKQYVDTQTGSIGSGGVFGQNADLAAARALTDTDHGKIINCSNAAAITITCPNNLVKDFYCTIVQRGAGVVTLAAAAGATLSNRQGQYRTAGQYAVCALLVSTNTSGTNAAWTLGGDTQT